MAFKDKLKSFINEIKENARVKSPVEETIPSQLVVSPAVAKFKEHLPQDAIDPQVDMDALDSIEEKYFNDESLVDTGLYELEKMPEQLSLPQIEQEMHKLKKQHQAVSRKVSELVLANHSGYVTELQRVMGLQQSVQDGSVICANGRRRLADARQNFTSAALGLLARYRKRQQLYALLKSLRMIETLQQTDMRLREMLEEEDYPGAIQLCLECMKAASTFRHYKCISELSSKLQDTLEMIEESLDVALSRTCNNFDESHYEKVQTAYSLLGKTQTAMDQLHMHFTSAIHTTAFNIVVGYVELCCEKGGTSFQKRQYVDLCQNINPEVFTPCLVALCKALWEVMKSYHHTIQWHEQREEESDSSGNDTSKSTPEDGKADPPSDSTVSKRYIRQKLEMGLGRIWADVQQKVKMYILSSDLSTFKFDEFIHVLDIVNRLIQIGDEFCGSKSESLQDSLRKQSVNYFRNYHRACLDELRMFLENEAWEMCPVKSSFSILMLQEFRFLRNKMEAHKASGRTGISPCSPEHQSKESFFAKYIDSSSPFDIQAEEEEKEEDVLETTDEDGSGFQRTFSQDSDSDDDIPDELKQDFIDEQTGEVPVTKKAPMRRRRSFKGAGKLPPIVTNTTLNLCRLFGKYMQMMTVLTPIAFDVTICMSQLFDYYLYAVYSFFATPATPPNPSSNGNMSVTDYSDQVLSGRLRTTLKRIRDNLVLVDDTPEAGVVEDGRDKIPQPYISPMVTLYGLEHLHGLPARIVATESLVFLAEQFEFLQPHLEAMIPTAKKAFLQQFYSQTTSTTQELRKPVYRTVATQSLDFGSLLQLMGTVKWDVKDIMSQHSGYVDVALREFNTFKNRLNEVGRRTPIPKPVSDVIWEHCICLANRTFVEGYASAKKCTNEGRALMQLDFQQFLMKLEKLTDLRPIPDREFVEAYVKAYYLPETQLESWIRDHKEYSTKQMLALVNCVAHINKKSRQRLSNLIEEQEKLRH